MNEEGLTNRKLRLLQFLHDQDEFPKGHVWPRWTLELFTKVDKREKDLYDLFFFLTANGLSPESASDWVLALDYRNGRLVLNQRLREKRQAQIVRLKKRAYSRELFIGPDEKKIKNLTTGYVMNMKDTVDWLNEREKAKNEMKNF